MSTNNKPMLSVGRELLEELQWHYKPYDDYYHKESGYYCPMCHEEKSKGHDATCEIKAVFDKPAAQHQGQPVAIEDERAAYEQWQWRQDWPIEQVAGARRAEYLKRKFLEPERYETDRFNSGLAVWLARATRPVQPAPVAVVMPEPYSLAMFKMISGFDSVTPEQFDLVWSACRAETARLNGAKP